MGCCGSKIGVGDGLDGPDAHMANRDIDKELAADQAKQRTIHKLLLLGAGESGKSTLYKQMVTLYGGGFQEDDRLRYVSVVHTNLIAGMKAIIEASDHLHVDFPECTLEPGSAVSRSQVEGSAPDREFSEELGRHIALLWKDKGVQATFQNHRAKFQITDGMDHFFNKIDTIIKRDYIPDQQDVLRARVRTTGIVEDQFIVNGLTLQIFDVGGQRSERKKWIHCFEGVTAVLFVAALSEYDQKLFEDESTNRLHEALKIFEEICNLEWFNQSSIILFLNKRDLFAEKVHKVPLTVCFPEFNGLNTYEGYLEFIQKKFWDCNHRTDRQIYTHVTCATDTDNVAVVFAAVRDIIVRKNLLTAGLLP